MKKIIVTTAVIDALREEGFSLPDKCFNLELHMTPNSAMTIRYDVFLTDEDLLKLGRALIRAAEPGAA